MSDRVTPAELSKLGWEQVGWYNAKRGLHPTQLSAHGGIHEWECYQSDRPVFAPKAEA